MNGWHDTEVRVRYAETDQMGIAHHSNYLIWFEAGRSDLCRARGFSYKEMEEKEDALMVVAESYVRYKSPAFYEDVLSIRTTISEVRSRSIRFSYEIHRRSDEALIAEGETLPAIMGDPDFLARNNMEIVDSSGNVVDPGTVDLNDPKAYRFRQRPGTDNSLGLVKFMIAVAERKNGGKKWEISVVTLPPDAR